MLILKLLVLQQRWRIQGVTALDLLNWIEGRIKLCYQDERLAGRMIKAWVDVGNPDDFEIPLDSKFGRDVMYLVREHNAQEKDMIRTCDIADRFRQRGKLWLVLKPDMRVVDEESVRVHANTCRGCSAIPADGRDKRLYARQDGFCTTCFGRFLPEDVLWPYTRSTLRSYRHRAGYGIDYDPVLGVCTPARVPGPLDRYPTEASETDGNPVTLPT